MTQEIHGQALAARFSEGTAPPATAAPEGATDCHHHIFDPRFPRAPGREGVWATVDDYRLLQRRLGLSRSVVVSPGSYGFDNSALLDALDQLGDSARGVACVPPGITRAQLDAMHLRGVRGIRLYLAGGMKRSADDVLRFAELVAPLGWHIQILPDLEGSALEEMGSTLARLPCKVVLDHIAYILQPAGINERRRDCVLRLLEGGNTWVKLSGLYISSHRGAPLYEDLDELAAGLAAAAPERVLWGSDWPHTLAPGRKPDGAVLFDKLANWVPAAAARKRILVENPQQLYWD
jgi:D-galactarolactone isomerase